ncbi:MAG: TrmH family RNA methyltransferase [Prolixibacteraceae bacterium]|nr:TrmH family RNA methyltransferase [Prolixibacteraceae bacterium]
MGINSVEYFKNNSYCLPGNIQKPILIGWKIQNPENCGNLIRLADTIGFSKVIFVKGDNNISIRKLKKTAGHSYEVIPSVFIPEEELASVLPDSYSLIAVETAPLSSNIFTTQLPANIALMVGNEKKGIDIDILEECDKVVHIPLTGNCTSLNVSHAAAVAAFEWLRQKMNQIS